MPTVSDDTEAVAWLRQQIEADLAAAKIISDGGFAPQRWDTEPPGQVNPAHDPASGTISDAIGQEREYSCGWVQIVVYERETGDPPEEEYREPGAVAAIAEIGRREFDHIIRHDPRSVVADCEAKLAILDFHGLAAAISAAHDAVHAPSHTGSDVLRLVVKELASAYKHRDGYAGHWAEAGS